MTPEEKEKTFNELKARVLVTPEGTPSFLQSHFSGYSFQFSGQKVAVFVVLAILILTTSTSFAAGGALPGDFLYPVKINVNEKVEGYIAEKQGAKQAFEVKVALNRLKEAEQLQTEGRLDEKSKEIITTNFEQHAANVQFEEGLTTSVVATSSLKTRFQAALENHRDVLKQLSNLSKKSDKPALSSLIMVVDNELKVGSSTVTTAAEGEIKVESVKGIDEKLNFDGGH